MAGYTTFCRYHYDPLDRLAARVPQAAESVHVFYRSDQLASETQKRGHRSFVHLDKHLLAYQTVPSAALLTSLTATDRQQSVLTVLGNGQPAHMTYTPYGHCESVDTVPGFNGEQPDGTTGHYLLGKGYRAYNPVLMRFNAPDSLSPLGKGGMNAYAYCAGDPINRSDPTGHIFRTLFKLGIRLKKALSSSKAAKAVPKEAGLGDLETFRRAPHILDRIVSNLRGDDLVSLSLASRSTRNLVKHNIRPLIIRETADELSYDAIYNLRKVAMGQAYGHLPSQVLKWENLKEMSTITPPRDIPMHELWASIEQRRALRGREREWRS